MKVVKFKNKKQRRKNRFKKLAFDLALAFLMCLCVSGLIKNYKMTKKLGELQKEQTTQEELLEKERERAEEIKEYEKYKETKGYVENMAREKLHLVYPDEILFMGK